MKQTYIIKLLSALFIVVLTGFASTSCSSDDDDDDNSVSSSNNSVSSSNHDPKLIGTWFLSSSIEERYYIFNKDGSGICKERDRDSYSDNWDGWEISNFKWSTSDGTLRKKWLGDYDGEDEDVDYDEYKISGNKLYIMNWDDWDIYTKQ